MGSGSELEEQPGREGLLVRFEYKQDRLNHQIAVLEEQIKEMERECDRQRTATMVAEIMLCVIAFVVGYAVGAML